MKIVVASENQGKLKEIDVFFKSSSLPVTLVAQSHYQVPSVEETGLSFVENALIKARHCSHHCALPALGDDSGLVVDALNGEPGIYSARYAGVGVNWQDNIDKLLKEMQALQGTARRAYFYCAIAFVKHANDPIPLICQAKWEGTILTHQVGTQGFGYDPVFFIPSLHCTAAEISAQQKNQLSHRAQALQAFVSAFKTEI